ncbi:unnamed protein product [Linum trigynum]|uniref:GATA-type domain-containing protein n=1 Tax=Linum trigynum TaxID=586398 RepID=A0AAV2CXI8_9ROSI
MMQRCSSSGVGGGPCSCGSYHCPQNTTTGSSSSSFSMLFSPLDHYRSYDHHDPSPPPDNYYSNSNSYNNNYYNSSSSSSSVDCTLSLGTPATRADDHRRPSSHHHQDGRRSAGGYVSNFCWDILQGTKAAVTKSPRPPSNNNNNGDPLVARRCANCDTTSTPLWRNGPRGPKSLCNACGIRFKKEERRATAATAVSAGGSGGQADHYGHQQQQQSYYGYGSNTTTSSSSASWAHQSQKMGCYSPAGEFRFIDQDGERDYQYQTSDAAGVPNFLSWRLNVTDRPGLVHDFTR